MRLVDVLQSKSERGPQIGIDLLRGAAAVAVFLCHSRELWLVPYADVTHPSIALAVLYFATGIGRPAVIVFFVLSGLLVGGSVCTSLRQGRFSWRRYLEHRASRLYVVVIPALVLTAVLDWPHPEPARYSFPVFLGNLAFLQGTLVPSFGSNHPLWSLANEAVYYLAFPLLLVPLWMRRQWWGLAVAALLLLGPAAVNPGIPNGFLLWVLGVGVSQCAPWPRSLFWIALPAFVGAVAVGRVVPDGFARDWVVALPTAVLLLTMPTAPEWLARPAHALAGFAFTLYAVHMPVLAALRAWITTPLLQPNGPGLALLVGVGAAVLGLAYAFATVTEARTGTVRAWLARL